MDAVFSLFGLKTSGITGAMTLTKSGSTARTMTFPDASVVVAGSASALTSGRVPFATTGGLLTDSASLTWNGTTLTASGALAIAGALSGVTTITVSGAITHSGVNTSSGSTAGRLAYFGGSAGDGAGFELRGSTYAANPDTGFLRVGSTYVGGWTGSLFFLNSGTSAAFGASALLASERVRVAGGTMGTPGSTDALIANGQLYCGNTGSASIRSAGGLTLAGAITGSISSDAAYIQNFQNTSTGTNADARIRLQNNNSTGISIVSRGGGVTGTAFGITLADWCDITAAGTACSGLILGTLGVDKPIVFGVNASEVARFTSGTLSSGSFQVKYTGNSAVDCSGSINVATGKGYRVAGTQVVGGQGAAVADATDATSVIARLNDLLARCRAHGLIAT